MEKDFSPATLQSIQQEFWEYIHTLKSDVYTILDTEFQIPSKIKDAVIEMIEYNVVGGKMIRGLFAVYTTYAASSVWDEQRKKEAYVIGWCAELLQGAFLIADDIMDESETRRGKPSWYRVKRVGMMSINDSFILQTLIFTLIQKEITDSRRQLSLLTVFEKIKFRTEVGQMLDLNTVNQEDRSLNYQYFSFQYYNEIITNKTAYYTIFMPIYLGLVLSECDESLLKSPVLADLCLQLGRFFQIRDDYLDVFADPSVLKKEGTDIQEGKCSWVVLTVFSMCSEKDRDVLKQNYGKNDRECVDRVKAVMNAYDVHSAYHACEAETLQTVNTLISAVPDKRIVPVLQL
ncbi:hypothetical protein WA588_003360, partial [Blastocystis sp. NMH]